MRLSTPFSKFSLVTGIPRAKVGTVSPPPGGGGGFARKAKAGSECRCIRNGSDAMAYQKLLTI